MTEFISRKYGQKEFEVVIKTDSEDDYKSAEEFARELIGHAKPHTREELRPKGRWVRVQDSVCYWYECSECGEQPLRRYNHDCFTRYCPFCGAKMEDDDGKT